MKKLTNTFHKGFLRVLINVDILREGYDSPEASCLLVLRHTQSIALWRQMAGRVMRPKQGGAPAMILDMVQNYKKLGFPDERMSWSLKPRIEEMIAR